MITKPIPKEIYKAQNETSVRTMTNFSWEELFKQQRRAAASGLQEFANYLERLMNEAADAELEAVKNKKKVNQWFKKNEGHNYFAYPNKADNQGYLSFIYLQPMRNIYFFDDRPILQEVVPFMIANEQLVYFGEIKHQGTLHKAWTTPRNAELLKK